MRLTLKPVVGRFSFLRQEYLMSEPIKGRFQPGQSGNPGGKPKKTIPVERNGEIVHLSLSEIAREHTIESVNTLLAVMKEGANSDRNQAAKLMLEFGWGKPKQSLELEGPGGGPIRTVDESAARLAALTVEELRQFEAIRSKIDASEPG